MDVFFSNSRIYSVYTCLIHKMQTNVKKQKKMHKRHIKQYTLRIKH